MVSEIFKYITVYLLSMTKFMAGPSIGIAIGMPIFLTVLISVLGMMTSVLIFATIGERSGYPRITRLVNYVRNRQGLNEKFQYLWEKFGIAGVTFLTPVLFTPIIGTILVSAMGSPKGKIIVYMFFSAVFWSITLSKIVKGVV
jgi:membrane protein DedA with SNARE-associated domain